MEKIRKSTYSLNGQLLFDNPLRFQSKKRKTLISHVLNFESELEELPNSSNTLKNKDQRRITTFRFAKKRSTTLMQTWEQTLVTFYDFGRPNERMYNILNYFLFDLTIKYHILPHTDPFKIK